MADDHGTAASGRRRLSAAGGLVAAVTVLHFALLRGVFAFEPPQPGAAVAPPSARAMVVRGFEVSPMAAGVPVENGATATASGGTDGVGQEVQTSPLRAAGGADAADATGAAPADGLPHAGPVPAPSPRVETVPPRLAAPEGIVPPVRAVVAAPAVALPAVVPVMAAAPVVADAVEALPVDAAPDKIRMETPVVPATPMETPSVPAAPTVASSVSTAAPTSAMPAVPDAVSLPTLERPEPAVRPETAGPDAPLQAAAATDAPADAADTLPLLLAQATPTVRTGTGVVTDPSNVPVYRTRMPPPVTLNYDLKRGMLSGIGKLEWQPQGQRYTARLEGTVAGIHVMGWESTGTIDADGIAPVRYTDERRGRGTQAANFQRTVGGGGKITYSGPSDEKPLPRGTQDRLTWLIQLAAVAAAEPSRVGPGGRVSMFVTGARADADVWSFARTGEETLSIGGRSVSTLKLIREPRYPRDSRVEAWLDPERHYLPVRARLSNGSGSDAGEALELMLRE